LRYKIVITEHYRNAEINKFVIFLQSRPIIWQLVRGKWISRELDKGDDSVIHSRLALACTCSATDKIIYSMNEIVLHASVHGNWHEHRRCSFQSDEKPTSIICKNVTKIRMWFLKFPF